MTQLKGFMQRFFNDVWNQPRAEAIDDLVSVDCRAHGLGHEVVHGNAAFKQFHQALRSVLKDIEIIIHDELVDGERVAFRAVLGGCHKATERPVSIAGGGICRVVDGKIVEAWNMFDFLAMLEQIGQVPENSFLKALTP